MSKLIPTVFASLLAASSIACAPLPDAAEAPASAFIPWGAAVLEPDSMDIANTGAPGDGLPGPAMSTPRSGAAEFRFEQSLGALDARLGMRVMPNGDRVRRSVLTLGERTWFFGYAPATPAVLELVAQHRGAPVLAMIQGCRTEDGRELRASPEGLQGEHCTHYVVAWDPGCGGMCRDSCSPGWYLSTQLNACVQYSR